ncbi:hypothetical protein [Luteibacter yeojuensis]|uniref:Uncharacterized protein n=1 Tax=Luteibacter yeojuensis TaxID=345309 RepID=A0A7X5QWH6_9GAMM|nr:hypothetical protein [Luteibacter yeojuensis]NID16656.1 hypothetical protein [Luteibacter yeojuensis]
MNNWRVIVVIVTVVATTAIYMASNWWERAFATYEHSNTSPDGCIRIDAYKSYWILPSAFHRTPHPDPEARTTLGREWDLPMFYRAYEVRTGALLGETVVFDASVANNLLYWGDASTPGRRIVNAYGFPLVDSDRCSDEATLAKLETFNKTQLLIY